MVVEIFSWPNFQERMCRMWGSISGPPAPTNCERPPVGAVTGQRPYCRSIFFRDNLSGTFWLKQMDENSGTE